MQGNPTLLLIRPLRESVQTAEHFRSAVQTVVSPVLDIQPVAQLPELAKYDHLIFTSKNAVRAVEGAAGLSGKPVFAVGQKTGELASSLGMRVRSADGDVSGLVDLIVHERPGGKLLHVRGQHSAGKLAETLKKRGLDTDSAVVYDQIEQGLTDDAVALLEGKGDVVLPLFSPRTAMLFSKQAAHLNVRSNLHLVAISENAMAGYDGPEPASAIVANSPESAAMFRNIRRTLATTP